METTHDAAKKMYHITWYIFLQRAVAERTETMGLIQDLAGIYEQSCIEYEQGRAETFRVIERFGADGGAAQNRGLWAYGDNAAFMHWLLAARGLGGKVQLIYADPPFFSKANYEAVAEIPLAEGRRIRHRAYADVWAAGMESYLKMLCVRLLAMRDLLADEGTIWVHLDWHSVHYVKILLDEIFGDRNFVNEIIWQYKSGGSSKRHFARKHDTILVYGKTPKYYLELPKEKSYNRNEALSLQGHCGILRRAGLVYDGQYEGCLEHRYGRTNVRGAYRLRDAETGGSAAAHLGGRQQAGRSGL